MLSSMSYTPPEVFAYNLNSKLNSLRSPSSQSVLFDGFLKLFLPILFAFLERFSFAFKNKTIAKLLLQKKLFTRTTSRQFSRIFQPIRLFLTISNNR